MKYEAVPAGTKFIAENEIEQAALDWAVTNAPIFAGMEGYGIEGFIAGAEWAKKQAFDAVRKSRL
jgi:hypothetical protein